MNICKHNKPRSQSARVAIRSLALVGLAALMEAGSERALAQANLTWDITPGLVGAGDSAITGGTGNWDLVNGNWTSDGGVTNVAWVNGVTPDNAIFGGATGTVTLTSGITVGNLTFNTGVGVTGNTLTFGSAAPTITANGVLGTISSVVAGTAGLTFVGTGGVAGTYLDGNNTYGGVTNVNSGFLIARHAGALGLAGDGTVVASGATLQLEAGGGGDVNIVSEAVTISGTGVGGTRGALASWAGNNTWGGNVVVAAHSTVLVNSGSLAINGVVSGAGTNFTKIGAGELRLGGAATNTLTGTTILDNGNLVLGKTGGAFAISGPVQMGGTVGNQPNLRMAANEQFAPGVVMTFVNPAGSYPRFDLQGTTQTLAGISDATGAGVIQNEKFGGGGTSAAATLTLNNTANFSYNGYLRDRDNGPGTWLMNVVKNGGGTQTLAGGNISYTGTTIVNAGVLEFLNAPGRTGTSTVNGGTLRLDSNATVFNAATTINAGGTLNFRTANTTVDANRYIGALTGTGTIMKDGPGWFHVQGSAPANFQGKIDVLAGRFGNAFNTTVWTNSQADVFVASGAELDLRTDDMIVDELTGSGTVINTFNVGETNTLTVGVANGSSQFDGVIRGTLTGVNNTSIDAGKNALTKTGTGTFTVTGANVYVGPTNVNNGVLRIGNGGTTGQVGPAAVTVTGAGTLAYNRSDSFSVANAIGGTGNVRQTGSGTVTIANASYTGTTTVSSGTLVLSDVRLVNGAKTVASGATLEINSSTPFLTRWNNSGTISGTGTINKTGTGVFGTTGAVNFAGTLNILNGRVHNDNVTGNWTGSTADVNISAPGVLDLRANDVYVDELNGTGEIWNSHPAGGGDVLYVGVANGSSSFGGIIRGDGSQAADNPNGAVLSLTKRGTGTFTITGGTNNYSGATTVDNGVLRIAGGNDRLPTGTNLTVNGGASVGGTFDLNGLNQTVGGISGVTGAVAGKITSTTGPATLNAAVTGTNSFTTAANLVDTGANVISLTKSGTGTQGLAGNNTFSGTTLITGGALRQSSATALSPNSNVQMNGGILELGVTDYTAALGIGGGQVQFTGNGGFGAFGGNRIVNIGGAGGTMTWGAGNFVPASSSLILSGPNSDSTTRFLNPIDLNGAGRITSFGGSAAIDAELVGNISNGTLTLAPVNGTIAVTGQISANVVVENGSTGATNFMQVLLNRPGGNAITGNLQIGTHSITDPSVWSTVRLEAADQIGDSSIVSFGAAQGRWSYLNLNGFNETVGGVSNLPGRDGGVIQLVEADASPTTNSTLTLNVTSGTQSYLGHIRDRGTGASTDPGGNGKLNFVKEGAGTQELTTWNTQVWGGSTSVNNGTLRIALSGVAGGGGSLASPTTVAAGATLDLGTAANNNGWTFNGLLSGPGNIKKSGDGIVSLTGAGINPGGPTNVAAGTLRLTDIAYPSPVTISTGATLEENRTTGSGTLSATMSGPGNFSKIGAGETIVSAPFGHSGSTHVRGGTLTTGAANVLSASSNLTVGGSGPATVKLNGYSQTVGGLSGSLGAEAQVLNGSATPVSLTVNLTSGQTVFGGKIGGASANDNNLGVVKQGAGTLVFTGQSSYTGGLTVSGGTVQLGASTAMPSVAGLSIWLDGADPAATGIAPANGAAIPVWKNKGTLGAAGDFAAVAGQEPAYASTGPGQINGNNVVHFEATPADISTPQASYDRVSNPINLTSGPSTVLVAGRYTGTALNNHRLVAATGNNWLLGWWNGGVDGAYYTAGFVPGMTSGNTAAHTYSAIMRGDGTVDTFGELGRLGSGAGVGPTGLALGSGYLAGNTENSTGDIGELIVVQGTLADGDRAALEAYLARKWAGTVPTNPLPTTTPVALTASGAKLFVNGVTQTIGSLSGVVGSIVDLGGGSLTVGDSTDTVFAGNLNGSGSFIKTGSGKLELSGTNTPSGNPVIVQGGTLSVTGSLSGSTLEIQSGGTLAGNGVIGSDVYLLAGAKLSPGTSPGTLSITGTTLDVGDAVTAGNSLSLVFEVGAVSDKVLMPTGQLGIGIGVLEFDDFVFTPTPGFGPGTYTLFDTTQDIFGTLGTNLSGTVGGLPASISFADAGHDVVLSVVPEPSALLLLSSLGWLRLRRRRA